MTCRHTYADCHLPVKSCPRKLLPGYRLVKLPHMPERIEAPICSLKSPGLHQIPSESSRRLIRAGHHRATPEGQAPPLVIWQKGAVDRATKEQILQQRGCIIWFTGLSGSGKSTVAIRLEHALARKGRLTILLDGDNIRHGLNNNLTFSREDRSENIRRIGEVSKLMAETGVMTLTSFISPYSQDRAAVRSRMQSGDFIEVYMDVPLEVCESRDSKGLYKLARAGKIKQFTGIDDPYEKPENPEIILPHAHPDGSQVSPEDMAALVMDYLVDHGFLSAENLSSPIV